MRSTVEVANALAALRNLAETQRSRDLIAQSNGIPAIVKFVALGTHAQKTFAAGVLWHLSESSECQAAIGEAGGVEALVELVRYGEDVQRENATGALMKLAELGVNRDRIASCGGVEVLVACVQAASADRGLKSTIGPEIVEEDADRVDTPCQYAYEDSMPAEVPENGSDQEELEMMQDGDSLHSTMAKISIEDDEEQTEMSECAFEDGEVSDDDGGINGILQQLKGGNREEKIMVLRQLCDIPASRILSITPVISIIVAQLHEDSRDCRCLAAKILRNMCQHPSLETRVVDAVDVSSLLRLATGSDQEKYEAALLLKILAEESISVREAIAKVTPTETMISLLFASNSETKLAAMCTLQTVIEDEEAQKSLMRSKGIQALVNILMEGVKSETVLAVHMLSALHDKSSVEAEIYLHKNIDALICLFQEGAPHLVFFAVRQLIRFPHPKLISTILKAGCVRKFVSMLQHEDTSLRRSIGQILSSMSSTQDGALALMSMGMHKIFARVVQENDIDITTHSSLALSRLSAIFSNRATLSTAEIVCPMISLLLHGTAPHKTHAAKFLLNLSREPPGAMKLARANCIPILIASLKTKQKSIRSLSVNILLNILRQESLHEQAVEAGIIPSLVGFIRDDVDSQQTEACKILNSLANSPERVEAIGASGGISVVLAILKRTSIPLNDEAATLLIKLGATEFNRLVIVRQNGVRALVESLRCNLPVSLLLEATRLLEAISEDSRVQEAIIIANGVPCLMDVLRFDKSGDMAPVKILVNISRTKMHRPALVRAGVMPLAVRMLSGTERSHEADCFTEILVNLASEKALHPLLLADDVLLPLVALAQKGYDFEKQHAAGVLAVLADDYAGCIAIQRAGGIPPLIGLLSDQFEPPKANALWAVCKLAEADSCRLEIREVGGVSVLRESISTIRATVRPQIERALWLLTDGENQAYTTGKRQRLEYM